MNKVEVNILGLTPLDRMSDSVGVKLMALTPILANIVMVVKQVRFHHVMKSDKFSEVYKQKALDNMIKFNNVNVKSGRAQAVGVLALAIIALFASSFIAPPVMIGAAVVCLTAALAMQLHLFSLSSQVGKENIKMMKELVKRNDLF
jgi:hypothetical protein